MGAHTQFGNYVIDYRKVRHYNCPDLTDFRVRSALHRSGINTNAQQLTPFVTKEKESAKQPPKKMTAREYLEFWRERNPAEYDLFDRLGE